MPKDPNMKHAETVTFGGSGFDRAGHLRKEDAALDRMRLSPDSLVLPVWRGKPLLEGTDKLSLAFVAPGHSVLSDSREAPVFLGLDGDIAFFAQDVSRWTPSETDERDPTAFIDMSEQLHPDLPSEQRFADLRLNMTRLSPRDAELAAMSVGVFAWHRAHRFCARCGHASNISAGGWQRSCPACNAQHFPRTDPVVIMLITRGNKVLIGRSPGWPEGMFSLLAGFMEPGETLEAAVRREVFEETAVKVGDVGYLASQPWPFPSSLMIGCWGDALSEEITIDPVEIEDAKWVSREDIMDAWATRSSSMIAARKGSIAHFLIKNWLSDTVS